MTVLWSGANYLLGRKYLNNGGPPNWTDFLVLAVIVGLAVGTAAYLMFW